MAAVARGACRFLPQMFNFSSKRTLLFSSSFQSIRLLHITRALLGDRKFTKKHEWISVDNGIGTVGVTDYAQDKLGEIVYVQLPDEGTEVAEEEEFGALESVKAAADIYSPASGTVVEVNTQLEDNPELVNKSPYDEGWLIKIKLEASLPSELLTEEEYNQFLKDNEEED